MTGNPSLFPYHEHVHSSLDDSLVLAESSIQELLSLGGDGASELVAELVDLYLEDSRQRLAEARSAFESGEVETVFRTAHALKSSSANMGAREFSRICANVEALEQAGDQALEASHMDQMTALYAEVERALEDLRTLCGA